MDSLERAATDQQFREALSVIAAGFDLPAFAYLDISSTIVAKPHLISNYAEGWARHYFAKRYFNCDPVILRALRDPISFEWGPDLARSHPSSLVRAFFDEAACFGIRYGFTIPMHVWRGRTAALTFATDRFRAAYRESIRKCASALQALAYQFHARLRDARELWHAAGGVVLTFRQRQCLYWAAEGKSFGEIAQIVGIMPRTAKFHIDNAKMKFGVRTAREAAIAFAISRYAGFDQPVFSGCQTKPLLTTKPRHAR